MKCPLCNAALDLPLPIGRRDECPGCRADLHACRCCVFYDPNAHNECREPQADRVADKEMGNFCDYFRLSAESVGGAGQSAADKAKAQLDALFKK